VPITASSAGPFCWRHGLALAHQWGRRVVYRGFNPVIVPPKGKRRCTCFASKAGAPKQPPTGTTTCSLILTSIVEVGGETFEAVGYAARRRKTRDTVLRRNKPRSARSFAEYQNQDPSGDTSGGNSFRV
jgi:hypothetical protein